MASNNNSSASDALNTLKMLGVKKSYQSFKDLVPGEYIIEKFKRVETSHGGRVRIDIGTTYMLLPERYNDLSDDDIKLLNSTPKVMVYDGKDSDNLNRLILDFRDTQTYFAEALNIVADEFQAE